MKCKRNKLFVVVCDIANFPQITIGPSSPIYGPLLPNTPGSYSCDDANFMVNGVQTNQCDDNGDYETTTAPTCDRCMCLVHSTASLAVALYRRFSRSNFWFLISAVEECLFPIFNPV